MKNTTNIRIENSTIETVVRLSNLIPEFNNPYPLSEYQKRLTGTPSCILVAYINHQPAGFKVGYEREGCFYSWMGGVLPIFRRMGVACKLAKEQEKWAKKMGYPHVTFKTRNKLKPMLVFALNRGFNIIDLMSNPSIEEFRIVLRKKL